ncbi:MAG: Zn-dependent hydrolase [Rhodospirillales bacterium]
MDLPNIAVDKDRLWQSLMQMARVGATDKGGNCRLALTDLDKEGRDLFVGWCKEAGMTVKVDRMGNIFARREGRDPGLPPVVTGSHLDTQPHGGKFDGVYGVLAGLEVVRTLNDRGFQTDAAIEVAVWTNEEGSRFAPAMVASGVFAGVFTEDYAHARTDAEGKSLGGELERIGYLGEMPCGGRKLGAFFEAHIEQGPILEAEQRTIGVVTGAQGSRWFDAVVTGQDSHAGTTPMNRRRDALLGAARLVERVHAIARAHGPHGVGTVGVIAAVPGSRNTIPGEARLTVDLRHPDDARLAAMAASLHAAGAAIGAELGLEFAIKEIWHSKPVRFDPACVEAVRRAAKACGFDALEIVSGAGHDACYISRVAPTGMIFVPCAGGLSHNEVESATPEDLAAGCNVLLRAMLSRAVI